MIERSVERIGMYEKLDTVKLETTAKSIDEICDETRRIEEKC